MSEPLFDPSCRSISIPADDDRRRRRPYHECNQEKSCLAKPLVILRMRNRLQRARKENRQCHQNAESSNVKDAFDRPHGKLRREGKTRAPSNEIRTDEFPCPPQERQPREPDQRRRHQFAHLGLGSNGFQENLPANRPHDVSEINQDDPVENVPLLDPVGLAPKRSPIKCSPMPVLQINKNCQNAEHHQAGQNSLLIHVRGKLRAAAPQREVGNGKSKVNERAIRVKLRSRSLGSAATRKFRKVYCG